MDKVKKALKNGLIIVTRGSTCAFVAEEILHKKLDKGGYVIGFVSPKGLQVNRTLSKDIIIERGRTREDISYTDAINRLKAGDVYIKGANALDPNGNAGILLAGNNGGTIGKAIGIIVARGVNLIIPVGLEKSVRAVRFIDVRCQGIVELTSKGDNPV